MKKTQIKIQLPVAIFKEGKKYIAFTPALDLSTQASTYEKAKERFNEIVSIFIDEMVKQGTLEENLKNLGWNKVQKQWKPPVVISQSLESFNITTKV